MNIAFIPVRGGSKSIPLKNIKPICGKPLVYWTIKAACECKHIDKVYVATDSPEIWRVLREFCSGDINCDGCKNLSGNSMLVGADRLGDPDNENRAMDCSDCLAKRKSEKANNSTGDAFEKLEIVGRSAESASDTASTEFAMLEFASKYEFDNIVLIQATSPLLTAEDLNRGFEVFNEEGTDSVLSVVRQKRFNWSVDAEGFARPSNYDVFKRPRRQEFDGYLVENGAFYITSKDRLMESENRVSGKIKAVEMPEDSFFEIDEPSDFEIIEGLMKKRMGIRGSSDDQRENRANDRSEYNSDDQNEYGSNGQSKYSSDEQGDYNSDTQIEYNYTEQGECNPPIEKNVISSDDIPEIKMFLTDCDGCLTDAGMYYSPEGDLLKKYNTKDGMGIRLLRERGILVGIVTGENTDINKRRVEKLKIDIYEPGCKDKLSVVKRLCEERGIDLKNVAYVGDDVNDLEVMKNVGFPCTVADGHKSVKAVAKYISGEPGGHGAVREIIDFILEKK